MTEPLTYAAIATATRLLEVRQRQEKALQRLLVVGQKLQLWASLAHSEAAAADRRWNGALCLARYRLLRRAWVGLGP